MKRDYYSSPIKEFLNTSTEEIVGNIVTNTGFGVEPTQRDAWVEEITILKAALRDFEGKIYFEYSIPRMGKRIDVVLLIGPVLLVLEFKIGERQFTSYAMSLICVTLGSPQCDPLVRIPREVKGQRAEIRDQR
jgi:hypothetical protein